MVGRKANTEKTRSVGAEVLCQEQWENDVSEGRKTTVKGKNCPVPKSSDFIK